MSTFKRTFYGKTGNIKLQVNKSNVAQLFSATKKELGMRSQVGFILAFQAAVWKSFHRIFFISQKQQTRQTFLLNVPYFVIPFFLPLMTRLFS